MKINFYSNSIIGNKLLPLSLNSCESHIASPVRNQKKKKTNEKQKKTGN